MRAFLNYSHLGYWVKSIHFVGHLVLDIDSWSQAHTTSCTVLSQSILRKMPQQLRHWPCFSQHTKMCLVGSGACTHSSEFCGCEFLRVFHFFPQSYSQDTGHLADSTSFCPWSKVWILDLLQDTQHGAFVLPKFYLQLIALYCCVS